jgi:hypothetical protein
MAVDEGTTDILFFSEAINFEGRAASKAALTKLAALISEFGGTTGDISVFEAGSKSGKV